MYILENVLFDQVCTMNAFVRTQYSWVERSWYRRNWWIIPRIYLCEEFLLACKRYLFSTLLSTHRYSIPKVQGTMQYIFHHCRVTNACCPFKAYNVCFLTLLPFPATRVHKVVTKSDCHPFLTLFLGIGRQQNFRR